MSDQWSVNERIVFHDSLERCIHHGDFIGTFYDLFINCSEEVRKKFAGTDFKTQKRALRMSFYMILLASGDGRSEGAAQLDYIARRHSKSGLDIRPELYALWRQCLLQVVEETDPQFDGSVRNAWQKMIDIGIQYLVDRYEHPAADAAPDSSDP